MFRLFETIRMDNAEIGNLEYHQDRIHRSCLAIYHQKPVFSLIRDLISFDPEQYPGIWKIRLTWNPDQFHFECEPYQIRRISRFFLVESNHFDYSYKYCDRTEINRLLQGKPPGSDVMIVKNGLITDASYANLVFRDAENRLFTPDPCLLAGTRRQQYIDENRIIPVRISPADLNEFTHVCRINAMIVLGEDEWLPLSAVIS
jgi:4-amino-4-deoxychorismate lyase